MKKAIVICDLCHKEYDEKTSKYASIFLNENGMAYERIDLCNECKDKMYKYITEHTTEKGGAKMDGKDGGE